MKTTTVYIETKRNIVFFNKDKGNTPYIHPTESSLRRLSDLSYHIDTFETRYLCNGGYHTIVINYKVS